MAEGAPEAVAYEDLLPRLGPDFAAALLLAAFRPDARRWLGPERLAALRMAVGDRLREVLKSLDRAPLPPAALGEPVQWLGCRIPLVHGQRVLWSELFWRPDRRLAHRGVGGFAFRLRLPALGAVEIRGRLEEERCDAILYADRLSPEVAWRLGEAFDAMLGPLGLEGRLTVRPGDGGEKTRPE